MKFRNLIFALAFMILLPFCAQAQNAPWRNGDYNSVDYAQWKVQISPGSPTGNGTQTFQLQTIGGVELPNGRTFQVFSTNTPVLIGVGANQETATPSAVSGCLFTGQALGTCSVTFTGLTNSHGPGDLLQSGDQGIQEAINDAAASGGGQVWWRIDTGQVTLSTGAANTNLGAVNIPARSVVISATARVNVTIGTCTGGWSLGITSGTEFTAANTTLTAGTTTDSSTGGTTFITGTAGLPIAHCTTANASAGAIHAVFQGYKLVAPSF
jgi:hypothetical protein